MRSSLLNRIGLLFLGFVVVSPAVLFFIWMISLSLKFEIDNGAVERAIREPAIGRKNYLFTGSEGAAHRLAAAYTLVQSCRALGVPTREYLIDVFRKLEAGWPARRLAELMPHRWTELRP